MDAGRRRTLLTGLFGSGWLGLRALASGIPLGLLASQRDALAATPTCVTGQSQYLVLVTSGSGDPLNANVPGCYANPAIYHSQLATMAPTQFTLGGQTVTAAKPWADLGPTILGRTCFFHHGTYTNGHGDHPKVNKLMGAVKRQEMLVSMVAKNNVSCLGTVQSQPIVLSNSLISYNGSVLPALSPPNLRAVLEAPTGILGQLQAIRDKDVDALNALYKTSGTSAQRTMLDRYALSQTEVRKLEQTLLADLASISGTTRTDNNIATAVLIKMKVSPSIVMGYNFGGDNHGDTGLANESAAHVASCAAITDLYTRLTSYGLQDQVTIAFQNVFGRSLHIDSHSGNPDGRNHNSGHHATVLIGKAFKGSVIGGVVPTNNARDFRATGITSTTGASSDGGDIPYEQTLASVGKTLAKAVGLEQTVLDDEISTGKVVTAALA